MLTLIGSETIEEEEEEEEEEEGEEKECSGFQCERM